MSGKEVVRVRVEGEVERSEVRNRSCLHPNEAPHLSPHPGIIFSF